LKFRNDANKEDFAFLQTESNDNNISILQLFTALKEILMRSQKENRIEKVLKMFGKSLQDEIAESTKDHSIMIQKS
jgi:hypothetical protein